MNVRRLKPTTSMRLGVRIQCVTRTDRVSPYHRIRAIGGTRQDGTRWRLSEEAAITAIDTERASFYLEWPAGHRLDLVVAQGLGKRYLKVASDGESPDRLLALPDCD